jgi:hypothetical protein
VALMRSAAHPDLRETGVQLQPDADLRQRRSLRLARRQEIMRVGPRVIRSMIGMSGSLQGPSEDLSAR